VFNIYLLPLGFVTSTFSLVMVSASYDLQINISACSVSALPLDLLNTCIVDIEIWLNSYLNLT